MLYYYLGIVELRLEMRLSPAKLITPVWKAFWDLIERFVRERRLCLTLDTKTEEINVDKTFAGPGARYLRRLRCVA